MELSDHFVRHEAGRMIATLTRIFGVHNLALVEDVVQDALCRALDVWKFRGVPENPSAWLMATAKNRALDVLRRERTARTFAPELGRLLESEWTMAPIVSELFEPSEIKDDVLRMMFSCCHPKVPEEAQIALILNISCGFGAGEIASAFLSTEAAIEKRIARGKKVLASSNKLFELSDDDFLARLSAVHRALYLLFSEGYHGASAESSVRAELCQEAMRLSALLLDDARAATPASHALSALMCFHAGRLASRVSPSGDLLSLVEQDRSQWDRGLAEQGQQLLEASATGEELSEYHVEAAIAEAHSRAARIEDTPWGDIVTLYNTLMLIRPSPIVALNRAIAVAQHEGPERGLEELRAIDGSQRLDAYPFYSAALGELELRAGRPDVARAHFQEATSLARNAGERQFFERKIRACSD